MLDDHQRQILNLLIVEWRRSAHAWSETPLDLVPGRAVSAVYSTCADQLADVLREEGKEQPHNAEER